MDSVIISNDRITEGLKEGKTMSNDMKNFINGLPEGILDSALAEGYDILLWPEVSGLGSGQDQFNTETRFIGFAYEERGKLVSVGMPCFSEWELAQAKKKTWRTVAVELRKYTKELETVAVEDETISFAETSLEALEIENREVE